MSGAAKALRALAFASAWAAGAAGWGAARAEEGPSFDCARAASQAETLICGDAALAAKDRALAAVYAEALAAIRALDAGAAAAEAELKAVQRGWIKGRNDCWKAEAPAACVSDAYDAREAELVAAWVLQAPSGAQAFFCEGNRANTVTATFFDTPRPSARVERGDATAVGLLERSASGARYALPFGDELWIKGAEAQLVWRQGAPLSCEAAE
ncbi:MAG: MliC family protein [Pseudomonadota bacterium]